ncbi:MAG: TIGR03915 family putative DNA repair protein [Candidatus Pseudobacter hemicellulosilyticus]|uniref:TIGR03915 family putative DNA repair protein n=1 Tax=Candidatus Pseudobacter hemicellulosilyticus TaxID=3121375 RepID=A0AAJ6BFF3_9BACT|nr:MAG: TIGR03915 family putative DNA repair protein [Pseudobacter sp.]
MIHFCYDRTLEGFLTAVFEVYEHKAVDSRICAAENFTEGLFGYSIQVVTDRAKAARVWKGLQQRLTAKGLDYLACASLSELPAAEDTMLAFIRHVFAQTQNVEDDFSHPAVLDITRIHKMVRRERHRMKAFVRFQATKDGLFYAGIEPDFNVLPLIRQHFQRRYADQRWIIYDLKRKYGLYYDLQTVNTIELDFAPETQAGKDISIAFDDREELFQQLWKDYFASVNIASRKNMVLHLRHVPKRYWKWLPEKKLP